MWLQERLQTWSDLPQEPLMANAKVRTNTLLIIDGYRKGEVNVSTDVLQMIPLGPRLSLHTYI